MLKLNIVLNNLWVKAEIAKEVRKYFDIMKEKR
jgi:hypothetical protein